MRTFYLIAALLWTMSCSSAPPLVWEARIRVSADPAVEHYAATAGNLAMVYSVHIAELLGVTYRHDMDVWVRDEQDMEGRHGFASDKVIAVTGGPMLDYLLAHELAHWHMHGSDWKRLPYVVEEGLCDLVALDGVARMRVPREEQFTAVLPQALARSSEYLSLDLRRYRRLTAQERLEASALGWSIAQRHGIEGLRHLLLQYERREDLVAALL